jgi:hypothetical protein
MVYRVRWRLLLALGIITGIAALFPLGYGAFQFFFVKPSNKPAEHPKILAPTSPEKILKDYVSANPEEITWRDRQIFAPGDLRSQPRLILVGQMKSGKTREAAELIRRAILEELLIPTRIYDITPNLR